ncbi:MoaF-related domain-containing protein [Beijerinckia indica]|uniref:MoaF-like domain-containing protein n=1 Tax=Beijerinckia indica subsp. indica (strain ATCC 9039 / DSM 1715 / NCIMB 8712) TaxID=395963 RepID=B2IKQ4_BEII9|nr:hypothetical protein [Beijerinckia indica]ACB95093.1 conserved hypothetical protein [Beijerinckia indica subsp. indica ATCC 9039]
MNQIDLFPYAGRSFVVNYGGDLVFRNTYADDGTTVTAEFLQGPQKGARMTVPFKWTALEGGFHLLSWQEKDKSTVVHCDNFEAKTTRSFYTMMDGSFYVMSGTISE